MGDVRELMRTKSQKFLGFVETALNFPVTIERQSSRDESASGSILSRAISTRKGSRREEEEYEARFTGQYLNE